MNSPVFAPSPRLRHRRFLLPPPRHLTLSDPPALPPLRPCLLPPRQPVIERRQDEECEERRGDEPSNHDTRERSLDLAPRARRERHRDEAEGGDERGHEDGPESVGRADADGLVEVTIFLADIVQVRDEDYAIEDRDPEESDEADTRREGEVEPAEPEHRDAADEGEGHIRQDEE